MFARFAPLALLLFTVLPLRGAAQTSPKLPIDEAKPPGIALVLSGGGAKGLAHIGVLEVLDSAQVPIDLIVGTSIGAAVGGLYAAGYSPAQLEHFALSTNWIDVLGLGGESHRDERVVSQKDADNALLSLRFTGFLQPVIPQALSTGQRLTMLLNSMVINAPGGIPQDFLRDMRVPFVAVATDIVKGERKLFTRGDLTEALRASATLPLRFNPLDQDSAILMDGGLLANIPVDVARAYNPLTVIVSNTTAKLKSREELTTPWDVADQVISLMMQRQNSAQLRDADVVITPQTPALASGDFSNIAGLIEEGRVAARAMLPRIHARTGLASNSAFEASLPGDTLIPFVRELKVFGTVPSFTDSAVVHDRSLLYRPAVRSTTLAAFSKSLLQDYRAQGFSLARIDSIVLHPKYDRADFYIDEGHISKITISGNELVNSDVILRELPLYSGDVFRAQDADRASQNLTATGLFDFATVQITRDSLWPGTRIIYRDDTTTSPSPTATTFGPSILVTVRSRASNVLRLSVLADNEFGAQFSTELANENLVGTGLQLSLKGEIGPLSRGASLTIDAPRLFRSFATFFGQVYSGYRDISVYQLQTLTGEGRIISARVHSERESRDIGGRIKAGGQVDRFGAITLELRSEIQRWFSLETATEPVDRLPVTALRADLIIDTRDDAAYPHTGTLLSSYAESGLQLLGGEIGYTKIFVDLEQSIPLSGLHTLIPRLILGFGDSPLPLLERFSLGGMQSFYGLNEYELRGKQVVEGSMSYQIAIPHALFFPTFVSMRYDIGATWPEPEAIKFESLVHGIGAQVGLKTPLGLARFGIGENFRFNKNANKPIDLNKPRFYFSIGSIL